MADIVPTFNESHLERICMVLADTSSGLTGSEIGRLLQQAGIDDGEQPMRPTYSTGQPVQPGDWIRVYSAQYGVWHHGILRRLVFLSGGIAVEVIHNTKGGGVAIADWYDFAGGNTILLHRRPESPTHAAQVVARAEANIRKPYFLFAQNCEHFASFAFNGVAESESLQTVGLVAAGVFAVAILTSDGG
jgi:hypothetical protein